MDVVTPLLNSAGTEAVAVIGTAVTVILGIPIAFKAVSIGKRVISKF